MTKRDAIVAMLEVLTDKPRLNDLSDNAEKLLDFRSGERADADRDYIAWRAREVLADLLVGYRVEGVE